MKMNIDNMDLVICENALYDYIYKQIVEKWINSGKSIMQLAKEANICRADLNNFFNNKKTRISLKSILKLMHALHANPNEIFPDNTFFNQFS